MTKKVGKSTILIESTGDAECTDCGKVDELRPYGKDGAFVCFPCMMKDEDEGMKQFGKLFDGERDI